MPQGQTLKSLREKYRNLTGKEAKTTWPLSYLKGAVTAAENNKAAGNEYLKRIDDRIRPKPKKAATIKQKAEEAAKTKAPTKMTLEDFRERQKEGAALRAAEEMERYTEKLAEARGEIFAPKATLREVFDDKPPVPFGPADVEEDYMQAPNDDRETPPVPSGPADVDDKPPVPFGPADGQAPDDDRETYTYCLLYTSPSPRDS